MDSGAAGHVMPDGVWECFHVSNSSAKHQKRFVAWSGEHIRGLGEKNVPIRTNE